MNWKKLKGSGGYIIPGTTGYYKRPRYHSFQVKVYQLKREGLIKFVREEKPEERKQFKNFEELPSRHYFALA